LGTDIQQAAGADPLVLAPSAKAVDAVREAAEVEDAMTVDRVVFWREPRQYDAVECGTPFADLLEDLSLARADLEKTAPSPQ